MKTREVHGISGWQAFVVIAACVAVMVVTLFAAPT
jgi:hypothetical protein